MRNFQNKSLLALVAMLPMLHAIVSGAALVPTEPNAVDAVWHDRPPPPLSVVRIHERALAGATSADKRRTIAGGLAAQGADAAVLTLPDSWGEAYATVANGGLLNLIAWPMLVLSGVFFSLDGAPSVVQALAALLPLTHMLDAGRAVMLDGAGLLGDSKNLLDDQVGLGTGLSV